MNHSERWPVLLLAEWKDTYATLHMWMQIVGKVRLALCPDLNHWWGTAFYITARGLTTSPMPYKKGIFEVHFDFISHALEIPEESEFFPMYDGVRLSNSPEYSLLAFCQSTYDAGANLAHSESR